MRVKKLPMILALHLKRFKYMEQLHRYTKLSYRVVFPLELRLFNTSSDAVNLDRMYDLVAVVVHCGRYGQAGRGARGSEGHPCAEMDLAWAPRFSNSGTLWNLFHVLVYMSSQNKYKHTYLHRIK